MTASKLTIYNGALLLLGERNLATIGDTVENRRLLDSVYDRGGIKGCLEQAQWKFATRSSKFEYDPDVTPAFGYAYAYEVPSDFVLLVAICYDEYFKSPVLEYDEHNGYWYTDASELYIKYVSNHASWGMDYSLWPESFTRYVEAEFALGIVMRINPELLKDIQTARDKTLRYAKAKDAWGLPTKFAPSGSWSNSRGGAVRRDNGHRGRLIG